MILPESSSTSMLIWNILKLRLLWNVMAIAFSVLVRAWQDCVPTLLSLVTCLPFFYGGNVSYVLRERLGASGDGQERDRTYEFVVEWYLQGYTEGRGIEEQKENGLPTQIFTLV